MRLFIYSIVILFLAGQVLLQTSEEKSAEGSGEKKSAEESAEKPADKEEEKSSEKEEDKSADKEEKSSEKKEEKSSEKTSASKSDKPKAGSLNGTAKAKVKAKVKRKVLFMSILACRSDSDSQGKIKSAKDDNPDKDAIDKYSEKLFEKIEKMKCYKRCPDFSTVMKKESSEIADLLLNMDEIDGASVPNSVDNMFLVLNNIQTKMGKRFFQRILIKAIQKRNDAGLNIENSMRYMSEEMLSSKHLSAGKDYAGEEVFLDDFEQESPLKGTDEAKVDYFRELTAVHAFHAVWHAMSEFRLPLNRHFERFAYMHRQLLHRYQIERLTMGIGEAPPLEIEEFKGTLNSKYPNELFPNTSANLDECKMNSTAVEAFDLFTESYKENLTAGLEREEYYQVVENGIHVQGHVHISEQCAKDKTKANTFIGDFSTAARDPLFFRWHHYVQTVLQEFHKDKPYKKDELTPAKGIKITKVELRSRCKETNKVENYYTIAEIVGTDDPWKGKTLRSETFDLSISVENKDKAKGKVVIRVFLFPEEHYKEGKYFLELDRWTHQLTGDDKLIFRSSTDNSLTFKKDDPACAWPYDLYLPRGGEEKPGKFKLAVFIHDASSDEVNEGLNRHHRPFMVCGAPNRTDSEEDDTIFDDRHFGFPFDKEWEGYKMKDVLDNKEDDFGKVATTISIEFTRGKKASCETTDKPKEPEEEERVTKKPPRKPKKEERGEKEETGGGASSEEYYSAEYYSDEYFYESDEFDRMSDRFMGDVRDDIGFMDDGGFEDDMGPRYEDDMGPGFEDDMGRGFEDDRGRGFGDDFGYDDGPGFGFDYADTPDNATSKAGAGETEASSGDKGAGGDVPGLGGKGPGLGGKGPGLGGEGPGPGGKAPGLGGEGPGLGGKGPGLGGEGPGPGGEGPGLGGEGPGPGGEGPGLGGKGPGLGGKAPGPGGKGPGSGDYAGGEENPIASKFYLVETSKQ